MEKRDSQNLERRSSEYLPRADHKNVGLLENHGYISFLFLNCPPQFLSPRQSTTSLPLPASLAGSELSGAVVSTDCNALPTFVPGQIIGGEAAETIAGSGDCAYLPNVLMVKDSYKSHTG